MATPPIAGPPRKEQKSIQLKHLKDSPVTGRFAVVNHFNSEVAKLAPTSNYPRLSAFSPQHLSKWVASYLKFAFQRRFPFPDYTGTGKTGLYQIAPSAGADSLKIAIVGDWGTGTLEAEKIGELMSASNPDFTIHLGDVYYVGDEPEIGENFLGRSANGFDGVSFPHGSQGSFALNGNHEMYANGKPYFTTLLGGLGMKGDPKGQSASFFSLETDSWRILGIDTGYNSVGIPILSQIPGVNNIPAIGGDCHLESKLLDWMRNTVKVKERPKATLILSHHEYFTRFKDPSYTKPAKQLAEFFGNQEVVWLWGHEHRLAIYEKFKTDGGLTAFGRCVGHGGMPVETAAPVGNKDAPLRLYDTRERDLDGTKVGINGYVNANIQGNVLTLDYRDIDSTQLFSETFTAGSGGSLQYAFSDPGVLVAAFHPSKP